MRRAETPDGAPASEPLTVSIPARPEAPAELSHTNATSPGGQNGTISGVTEEMEYRLDTEDAWTPCSGTEITGLAPGAYQVRYKATDSSFASASDHRRGFLLRRGQRAHLPP